MMIALFRCRWVLVVTRLVMIVVSNPSHTITVFKGTLLTRAGRQRRSERRIAVLKRTLLARAVFDHLVRKARRPGDEKHHRKQSDQLENAQRAEHRSYYSSLPPLQLQSSCISILDTSIPASIRWPSRSRSARRSE